MPIEFKKGAVPKPETTSEELDIMSEVITGVGAILEDAKARAQVHYDTSLPPEFREAQAVRRHFSQRRSDQSVPDPNLEPAKEEPQAEEPPAK